MTAADVHTLTGAHALNAVTDLERAAFDRHLRECPECERELREFEETAARLGAAVRVEPGEGLRDRVLARIGATPQTPPAVTPSSARSSRRWVQRAGIGLLATAAAAAVVTGGGNLGQRPTWEQNQAGALPGSAVLFAPDAATATAHGAAGGQATAVVSRGQGQFVLTLRDLPAPDTAHTYQAWLIGPGGPRSAGVLHAGGKTGVLTGNIPAGTDHIGVTTEPAAGSPQPTTPGVVMITLAR